MADNSPSKVYILRTTSDKLPSSPRLLELLCMRPTFSSPHGFVPTLPSGSGTDEFEVNLKIRVNEVCITLSGSSEPILEELIAYYQKLLHGFPNLLWRLSQQPPNAS